MFNIKMPRHAGPGSDGVDTFDDFVENEGFAGSDAMREAMSLRPQITSDGVMFKFLCGCAGMRNVMVSWPELACIAVNVSPAQLGLDHAWGMQNGGHVYGGSCDCKHRQLLTLSNDDAVSYLQRPEVQRLAAQDPNYARVYQRLQQMSAGRR